nr:hypothetical protein [Salinispora arenicola]
MQRSLVGGGRRPAGPVVDGRRLLGQLGELLVEDVTYGVVAGGEDRKELGGLRRLGHLLVHPAGRGP